MGSMKPETILKWRAKAALLNVKLMQKENLFQNDLWHFSIDDYSSPYYLSIQGAVRAIIRYRLRQQKVK